jgi:hypothetical protein
MKKENENENKKGMHFKANKKITHLLLSKSPIALYYVSSLHFLYVYINYLGIYATVAQILIK